MRTSVILACLAVVTACGDASSRARGGAANADEAVTAPQLGRPPAATNGSPEGSSDRSANGPPAALSSPSSRANANTNNSTNTSTNTSAVTPNVGALERPAALRHFFEALARLDSGQSHEDVRVVQFGDSHTAADYETGPLRRALQARFGDGGRGFVALGNPWKKYVQEGLRNGSTRDWIGDRGKLAHGKVEGDGMYGLCGAAMRTTHPGARAWAEYTCKSSEIELAYLAQPRGGSMDVFIDGARAGRVSTRASEAQSGWRAFDVTDGPHRVEVATVGDGEVRLFGAVLDRAQVGLTFDALGINGARVSNALAWSEKHLAEQLRHRAPDLVVLAYGTNEAGDDTPIEAYERQLVDVLGRIARATPSASCMLMGPPDRAWKTPDGWQTMPKLLEIIETQKRVAQAAGCAFYDQLEAMGGPGTITQWADDPSPRAGHDHVHFTREGYAVLANAIASDLLRAYGAWRADAGLPPGPANGASPASPSPRPLPPPPDPQEPVAHVEARAAPL